MVNQQPRAVGILEVDLSGCQAGVTDRFISQYGTTIPQLRKKTANGAVDALVKSRIVNQDDQAHSMYAEYEIVDQNGQVVSEKVRSEVQSFWQVKRSTCLKPPC